MAAGGRTGWMPAPDDELLLTAALHADERGVEAWARLRPRLDVDHLRVDQLALLPAVHDTLEGNDVDDPDRARLAGVRRKGWVRTTRVLAAAEPVLAGLAAADIGTVLLRDTAVVAGGLVDGARRPLRTLSVLVAAHDLPAAVAVARRLDVHGPGDLDPAAAAGLVAWEGTLDGDDAIALHWLVGPALPVAGTAGAITSAPWTTGLGDEPARSRAVSATVGASPTAVPDPADLLLQVALHEVGTGNEDHLRWVLDVAAVLAAEPDWALVAEEAGRRRVGRLLGQRLGYVADRFDLPVPPPALATLARSADGPRAALARRLVGTGRRRRALARYLLLTGADPSPAALRAAPAYRHAARVRRRR